MKVKVNEIPEEGLTLSERIDPAQMSLETPDLRFVRELEVTADFQKEQEAVMVQVAVRGEQEQTCARCLEHAGRHYERQFHLTYTARNEISLDITEEIRQEIFLSYPVHVLCKEDCQGLCPACGQNLNERRCVHGTA